MEPKGAKHCVVRILCDSLAIAVLAVLFFIGQALENNGIVTRRGFYCDDESIRYPYRPDTVPTWALVVGSVGIPLLALVGGNIYETIPCPYILRGAKRRNERAPLDVKCARIPPWILRLGFQFRWFVIGMLATLMLTQLLKVAGGRLRPHFLAVCQPDFAAINCTDASGLPAYITSYQCKEGENSSAVINARLSWPSAHASISTFGLIFASLYFASVPSFYCRSGIKLALIVVPILLSVLVASSRVTDYRHHPTDVLSGYILALLVCLLVVFYHLEFFGWKKVRAPQSKEEELEMGEREHLVADKTNP